MKTYVNEDGEIEFEDVFNAIVVKTPAGRYGICQRDGGIEIVQNHKRVFNSDTTAEIECLRNELAAERTAHTATREELRRTIRAADPFGI